MKFVIMAPANAKSQDGVLPDDELVEAMPEFGEAFAQAEVLRRGLQPLCSVILLPVIRSGKRSRE